MKTYTLFDAPIKVYGVPFFEKDRNLCAVDNIHPNDIGFLRMATVIRPVLEKALNTSKIN